MLRRSKLHNNEANLRILPLSSAVYFALLVPGDIISRFFPHLRLQ
jgi:hypothetical protein